jgi:cytochrome c553
MKKPLPSPTQRALHQAFAQSGTRLVLAMCLALGGTAFVGTAHAQGTAPAPAAAASSAPTQAAAATGQAAAQNGPRAGDAVAGAKNNAMCIGCHNISGYQASFPEIYKVPKIAGQSAPYIVAALNGYRKGERKHPTMRAIATTLSDQDMADLGAYYEQLGKQGKAQQVAAKPAREPSPQVAKLLAQANCASCHGANYATPIDPSYPKIAGQYADYLYASLKAYQQDKNQYVGRSNPIMMGMARPFTHAELKAMSDYIASLPSDLKTVQQTQFR